MGLVPKRGQVPMERLVPSTSISMRSATTQGMRWKSMKKMTLNGNVYERVVHQHVPCERGTKMRTMLYSASGALSV